MQRRSMSSPASDSYVSYGHNHTETSSTERPTGGAAGLSLTATGGVMIAATLVFFAFFVLLLCLCLRRKQCWGAIPGFSRSEQAAGPAEPAARVSKGLDASAVRALPSFVFWSAESTVEGPVECSVCLAELADGESALRLPRCGHGFHLECIEEWLRSHSSCPLCRSPVVSGPAEVPDAGAEPVGARLPAVVSGVGRTSSSQDDVVLVIELPSSASPLPSAGLGSLRRLLMLGGRGVGSRRSPIEFDVEQGVGVPKTPAR